MKDTQSKTANFFALFSELAMQPYPLRIADARDEKLQLFFLNLIYLLSCPCSETTPVINRGPFFFLGHHLSHLSSRFLNRQQDGRDRQQLFSGETAQFFFFVEKTAEKLKRAWLLVWRRELKASIQRGASSVLLFID